MDALQASSEGMTLLLKGAHTGPLTLNHKVTLRSDEEAVFLGPVTVQGESVLEGLTFSGGDEKEPALTAKGGQYSNCHIGQNGTLSLQVHAEAHFQNCQLPGQIRIWNSQAWFRGCESWAISVIQGRVSLDSCVVRGDPDWNVGSAGLFLRCAHAVARNTRFEGGGIQAFGGSVYLRDCHIEEQRIGLLLDKASGRSTLENCRILSSREMAIRSSGGFLYAWNTVIRDSGEGWRAGDYSRGILHNCTLQNCRDGAVCLTPEISSRKGQVELRRCLLVGNAAGLKLRVGSILVQSCTFSSNDEDWVLEHELADLKTRDLNRAKPADHIFDEEARRRISAHEFVELIDGGRTDFSGCNLEEVTITEQTRYQLDGPQFKDGLIPLQGATFRGATLTNSCLMGFDLSGSDFSGSDFTGGSVHGSLLPDSNFTGTKLCGFKVYNSILWGAQMMRCDLTAGGLYLDDPCKAPKCDREVTPLNFEEAVLIRAEFRGDFSESCFSRVKAERANFLRAKLNRADFRDADLREALFGRAGGVHDKILESADVRFQGADLSKAQMSHRNYQRADFRDCSLRSVNFSYCDLTGADLEGARLGSNSWVHARLDGVRVPEMTEDPVVSPLEQSKATAREDDFPDEAWSLSGSVKELSFLPDGSLGILSILPGNVVFEVISPSNGVKRAKLLVSIPLDETKALATASRDGTRVAILGPGGTIAVWGVWEQRKLKELKLPGGSATYRDSSISLSADGSRLAIQLYERVVVFDANTGEELFNLGIQHASGLTLSPDGRSLLWIYGLELHLQPLSGFPRVLKGEWTKLTRYFWSNDGRRLALLGRDIHILDLESEAVQKLQIPRGNLMLAVFCLAFGPNNKKLCAAGTGPLLWFDIPSGNCISCEDVQPNLTSLAVSPDGEVYLGHGTDSRAGLLEHCRPENGTLERRAEFGWRLLVPDNENHLLIDPPIGTAWEPNERAQLACLSTRTPAPLCRRIPRTPVALSMNGSRYAYTCRQNEVLVHTVGSQNEPSILEGDRPFHQSFSRDAKRLLVMQKKWTILYRFEESHQATEVWRGGEETRHAALHPDGSIAVVVNDKAISAFHVDDDSVLWDDAPESPAERRRGKGAVKVALVDGGEILLWCRSEGSGVARVRSYETRSGNALAERTFELGSTACINDNFHRLWAPGCSDIVLRTEDGFCVWDPRSGEDKFYRRTSGQGYLAFGFPQLSPDGSLLAFPEREAIRILSLPEGDVVDSIPTESLGLSSLCWLANTRNLVYKGTGRSYRLWPAGSG